MKGGGPRNTLRDTATYFPRQCQTGCYFQFRITGDYMKLEIIPLLKRLLLINLSIFVLFGTLEPAMVFATTERAWPIITFTCDKTKNEVKLKNEVIWGEAGENFDFNPRQGTYNPWSLVKIKKSEQNIQVLADKQLELKCALDDSDYTFVIKPKIFNHNFHAKCGNHLSVKVSVYKNQSPLVKDKPMETYCLGNAPVLRGIKVQDGKFKVKYYEVARSRFY